VSLDPTSFAARLLFDMVWVAMIGGILATDRAAGWSSMLSQPIVGSCLAGVFVHPQPEWEMWAFRIPIGVGALLQLLLTDASLPAAQRQHETATAGVVGSTVGVLGMSQLHGALPGATGGALWVVIGVLAGLLSAIGGGWWMELHRSGNRADTRRAEEFAARGNADAFAWLYSGSLLRVFVLGGLWTWGASLAGFVACLVLLPRLVPLLTAQRVGFVFAGLLGCGLATAYHAHIRRRPGAPRWAALGAVAAIVLTIVLRQGAP